MGIPTFWNVVFVISISIFLYFKVKFSYWSKRKIATPQTSIPFGNFQNVFNMKVSFYEHIEKLYKEMKTGNVKYFGVYLITSPELVVTDLDLIKSIMVKDFNHFTDRGNFTNIEKDALGQHLVNLKGQKWKNLRSKLTSTFTSGKMKSMFPIVVDIANQMVEALETMDLRSIDIHDIFSKFSTDVIGSVAFGLDINSFKDNNTTFRKLCERTSKPTYERLIIRLLTKEYPNLMRKLGVKISRKDLEKFFVDLVRETIAFRKDNDIRREDFLQLLLDLKHTKDELTFLEIVAQAFIFFVGGFLTSSTASACCCYELSKNEDVQETLRNEINEALKESDGELTYEVLHSMKYLHKCVQEALRKYPPAPELVRECGTKYTVPNTDQTWEAGTKVIIPAFSIHRDERYYPNPEVFDPERFSEENKAKRHQFAHLPFGQGPRSCIGERFGLMQTKIGVVTIIKNYKLSSSKNYEFEFDPLSIITVAKHPILIDGIKIGGRQEII